MVKAVNKLIMEVKDTESEYFEKAVLYIRPEMAYSGRLQEKAREYLDKCGAAENKRPEKKKSMAAYIAVSAATGALCAAVILIFVMLK